MAPTFITQTPSDSSLSPSRSHRPALQWTCLHCRPLRPPAPTSPHCLQWFTSGVCKQPCTKHVLLRLHRPPSITLAGPFRGPAAAAPPAQLRRRLWAVRLWERAAEHGLPPPAPAGSPLAQAGPCSPALGWTCQGLRWCSLHPTLFSKLPSAHTDELGDNGPYI